MILSLICAIYWWNVSPEGTSTDAVRCGLVFTLAIIMLITGIMPMGAAIFLSIAAANALNILNDAQVFSGYSSKVIWLIVCAFFVARGVIKSGLGARIAYNLIYKFGNTIFGLSYSLIFSEALISPMIPSATARSSGIFLPIGRALIEKYDAGCSDKKHSVGPFIVMLLFFGNLITSGMFATSMAGNPLAVKIAKDYGANITWVIWASAASVPGIISLLLLPFIISKVCSLPKLNDKAKNEIKVLAKNSLSEMGVITKKEIGVIITLITLVLGWIFEKQIGVNTTITTLFGVLALLAIRAISWNDILEEKSAWNTFIWFGGILSLSDALNHYNVMSWLISMAENTLNTMPTTSKLIMGALIIIYAHYIFASSTAYLAAVLGIFIAMYVNSGVDPLFASLFLSLAAILSSGFTHYGSAVAPPLLALGHVSISQWWKYCAIISNAVIMIWLVTGAVWWKIIGII